MKNKGLGFIIFSLLLVGFLFVGEVKCVVKAGKCDWEAPYKAEVVYTGSFLTGIGGIVGHLNIEDGPTN